MVESCPFGGNRAAQAVEPFGGEPVAGLGRLSVPAARPGVGDAVAVLVHRPQVVHGGGAAGRRGFLEPVARLGVVVGVPRRFRHNGPSRVIASASSRWARGGCGAGARRGPSAPRPAKVFTQPCKPATAARVARASKGGCVRWFFMIWVKLVSFGKSFAR